LCFACFIYLRTGNLRAVQLLLGHTKIESTVRYLGIEVDDALAIAEHLTSELQGKAELALPLPDRRGRARGGHLDAGIVMDRLMEPLGERLTATQSPPPEAG
jgi:hypothetical protein